MENTPRAKKWENNKTKLKQRMDTADRDAEYIYNIYGVVFSTPNIDQYYPMNMAQNVHDELRIIWLE